MLSRSLIRRLRAATLVLLAAFLTVPSVGARDGDLLAMTPMARLFGGMPHAVAYSDPYLFVGLDTGIECYDASNPANLQWVGGLYLPSPAYDLKMAGTDLLVANGNSPVATFWASEPALRRHPVSPGAAKAFSHSGSA